MQCGIADLGMPCLALPGSTLHTCTTCARTFHHLCAGEDAGWYICPPCKAMRDSAQLVQCAVPPNAGDGEAAGGRRAAAAAPASAGRGIGGVAAPTAAPPKGGLASLWNKTAAAPPRLASKPAAAKGPRPAVGRAAASKGLPRLSGALQCRCGGLNTRWSSQLGRNWRPVCSWCRQQAPQWSACSASCAIPSIMARMGHWKTTWSLRSCSSTTTGLALAFRSASATQRLLHSGAAARWRENRP